MVLNDKWIIENGQKGLVIPFDKELVNPTSLDIRIGYKMLLMEVNNNDHYLDDLNDIKFNQFSLIEKDLLDDRVAKFNNRVGWKEINLTRTSEVRPYWLFPDAKILIESLETFYFPDNICGQFRLKSSRGREFYEHLEAGWCDSGWHGSKLTMEIENRSLKILPVYKGLRMGQIIFFETETPLVSYKITGRYNNDNSVQISRG